jgi:hypothetical protein
MSSASSAAAEPDPTPTTARRSGRPWVAGQSGNPSGARAKPVDDIGRLCRKHARTAVAALVKQLASDDAQAAVEAARILIEHGFGAPMQHIALHAPTTISVTCHTADPEAARGNGGDGKTRTAWDA